MHLVNFSNICTIILLSLLGNCQSMKQADLDSGTVVSYDASVTISRDTSSEIFPAEWSRTPILAHAEPLSDDEALRAITAIRQALDKYPKRIVDNNLSIVHIISKLEHHHTRFSGLFIAENPKTLYLSNNGVRDGYVDYRLEMAVHHELAHLLMFQYTRKFSRQRWERLNARGFRYDDDGLKFLEEHHGLVNWYGAECLNKVFLNDYSMSDLNEDFASIVEALFLGTRKFWAAVDRNKVLAGKVKVVMAFYHSIDKTMTESYFRQLRQNQSLASTYEDDYNPNTPILFPYGGVILYTNPKDGSTVSIPVKPGGTATFPPGGGFIMYAKPDTTKPK